jgi:hypothetical protein
MITIYGCSTKGEESAILLPIPCDCGTRAASFDAPQDRALEGHFACGSGLLIESDFLGRSCATKTASRDATISLPNVPADWQRDGFLDSPAWSYESVHVERQCVGTVPQPLRHLHR